MGLILVASEKGGVSVAQFVEVVEVVDFLDISRDFCDLLGDLRQSVVTFWEI